MTTVSMGKRVIIRRCDSYDPGRIAAIVEEGMTELGARPEGRVVVKPNTVIAHPEIFPHAFTRSEFLDGLLSATRARAGRMEELVVAERCGITIPTRFAFSMAGYLPVLDRHRVEPRYMDESRSVLVELKRPGRLRDAIYVPEPMTRCEYLINAPKLKAHPWTTITASLKNYIGIQDDRHRLVDHNTWLEHKIVDLQEVVQSRFIAVDAIVAGQHMMLTPTPFHLGAIVMGDNCCAVDTVCAHMIHVDPREVHHLRMASERGLGPLDLADIEVAGDYPLDEVRERSEGFGVGPVRIDHDYAHTPGLRCTVGTFPEAHSRDYCWGGCPGSLQEAVHIHEEFTPACLSAMQRIHYVVGDVRQPLEIDDDEWVVFAGDCTRFDGEIDGERVRIVPTYRSPGRVSVHHTRSNDLLLKLAASFAECYTTGRRRFLHVTGCPVSVAVHVNTLSIIGGLSNPNLSPRLIAPYVGSYLAMHLAHLREHVGSR